MKVFSKEKFIEEHGKGTYEFSKSWVDKCDGKEVIDRKIFLEGRPTPYLIDDDWCIETDEVKPAPKKRGRKKKDSKKEDNTLDMMTELMEQLKEMVGCKYEVVLKSDGTTSIKGNVPSLLTALSVFVNGLKENGISEKELKYAFKLGLTE